MLITGFIDEDLIPYVKEVYVVGKNNIPIPVKAVLDTGFNGEFVLPKALQETLQLDYVGEDTSVLGDGSVIIEEAYEGQIIIGNQPHTVTMTFTEDDEALIGMVLLIGKIVTLNLKNNTITITS